MKVTGNDIYALTSSLQYKHTIDNIAIFMPSYRHIRYLHMKIYVTSKNLYTIYNS